MYVLPYHLGRVCFCEKPLQQQKVTKLGTINARSESNCMALQQNDSRSQNAFEHHLLRVIICKKKSLSEMIYHCNHLSEIFPPRGNGAIGALLHR